MQQTNLPVVNETGGQIGLGVDHAANVPAASEKRRARMGAESGRLVVFQHSLKDEEGFRAFACVSPLSSRQLECPC